MKKMILFAVFVVTVVVTICYYDDPKYYNKMFKKAWKKNMKKCECICELFNC